jgi:hypothetical protein
MVKRQVGWPIAGVVPIRCAGLKWHAFRGG